jgi:hypothetical protein
LILIDERDACGRNVERGHRLRERDLLLSTIDSDGDIALEVRRLRRESRRGQGQTGGESDKNEPAAKV